MKEKIELWIIPYLTFERYLLHVSNRNFSLCPSLQRWLVLHLQKLSFTNTLWLLSPLYKQSPKSNLCSHEPWSEGNRDPINVSRWKTKGLNQG